MTYAVYLLGHKVTVLFKENAETISNSLMLLIIEIEIWGFLYSDVSTEHNRFDQYTPTV